MLFLILIVLTAVIGYLASFKINNSTNLWTRNKEALVDQMLEIKFNKFIPQFEKNYKDF
jgi:hypothetical protein